jgi:hypothetical protein
MLIMIKDETFFLSSNAFQHLLKRLFF